MGYKYCLVREILGKLLLGGVVILAASSPYFWARIYKRLLSPYDVPPKKLRDTFYYLKRKGLIVFKRDKKQIYISLTERGKKEAGKFWRINYLKIKKPKKWDGKWWVIIFDIPENWRIKREALRGKLKEFGFYPLQKSVWVYPYPCEKEIKLLAEFFSLNRGQIRVLLVEKIEKDDFLRRHFNLPTS